MKKSEKPRREPLTKEERARLMAYLDKRDRLRHKIEMAGLVYMGFALLAFMLIDYVLGYQNVNAVLVFLAVAAVYFPGWWLLRGLWLKRKAKTLSPAELDAIAQERNGPPAG